MYNLEQIQAIVKEIADTMPVNKVILIGSYAHNTATDESDIDLIIDGDDMSDTYWDFLFKIEDALDIKVDVITVKGLDKSCLKDDFLEGGVVLYEA